MDNTNPKRRVIEAFSKAVDQTSFVLKDNPELIFQQVYNQLQWQGVKDEILKESLEYRRTGYKKPWLRLLTQPTLQASALVRTFAGHTGEVITCAFSPDGKRIISISRFGDEVLKLWNTRTAEVVYTLRKHPNSMDILVFSRDCRRFVSTDNIFDDKIISKLWDAETGEELSTFHGNTFTRTSEGKIVCRFSPDSRRILSLIEDNMLRVWDAETGEELSTFKGHTDKVNSYAFNPGCNQVISVSKDEILKLWDAETGEELSTFKCHPHYKVNTSTFSPDGSKIVFINEDNTLRILDVNSVKVVTNLSGYRGMSGWGYWIFSQDGNKIVTALDLKDFCNDFLVWDTRTGEKRTYLKGTFECPTSCEFTSNGNQIVVRSGRMGGELRLYDAETGVVLATTEGVWQWRFSPDRRLIVALIKGTELLVLDTETLRVLACLRGHTGKINDYVFSIDGKYIISGGSDKLLMLWDAAIKEDSVIPRGHASRVNACVFSPDGKLIVSASNDSTLKLWDAVSAKELDTLKGHSHNVTCCTFSPDCRCVVSASGDKTLRLWNIEKRMELYVLEGHTKEIKYCSYSPDGKQILSITREIIKLWHADSGKELAELKGHVFPITTCRFNPDGSRIVSFETGNVKFWDTETYKEHKSIERLMSEVVDCDFSPDGKIILLGSVDKSLKLWYAESGDEIAILRGHKDWVVSCSFSPDGKLIISASDDKTLKLWDSATGEEVKTFEGHTNKVSICAFSSDGKRIVSASEDKTLRLWDVEKGKELVSLRGTTDIVTACTFSPDGRRIVLGDGLGQVLLLSVENVEYFPPFITTIRIKSFDNKNKKYNWEANLKASCKWCGKHFPVSDRILDIIKAINHNAGLSPNQSPCLMLPKEAWVEPGLLSECPLCHKPLRFNPFIVDNRENN